MVKDMWNIYNTLKFSSKIMDSKFVSTICCKIYPLNKIKISTVTCKIQNTLALHLLHEMASILQYTPVRQFFLPGFLHFKRERDQPYI